MKQENDFKNAGTLLAARRRRLFQRILAVTLITLMIVGPAVAFAVWGKPLVSFLADADKVRALVNDFPVWSRFLFFMLTMLQVILAVIPGEPFELAAGYAFGSFEGTVLSMAAIYAASIIIFLVVKRYGRPVIELFFKPEQIDGVKLFNRPRQLNLLMFLLMFIPGTPKDILTYLAGLTPMKLGTWMKILLARFFSVVTSTVSGGLLGSKEYVFAAIVFGIGAVAAVIGFIFYHYVNKKAEKQEAMAKEDSMSSEISGDDM
jgi:uncharacterized membrane protein YdjX (TVP38/TMEM64 family)